VEANKVKKFRVGFQIVTCYIFQHSQHIVTQIYLALFSKWQD